MNIWKSLKWEAYYSKGNHRSGIKVDYDLEVDSEVKRSCKEFISWLRSQYLFPKRIRIYVKKNRRIKAKDGSMVCGTFFRPLDRNKEPYIRIATGDYSELVEKHGKDNALAKILWKVAHELTHYFQWLNALDLTLVGEERQATNYANRILWDYSDTRDHP